MASQARSFARPNLNCWVSLRMSGNSRISAPAKRGRGTARSAVEGASASKHLCRHSNDRISRFVDLTSQFACGNAHHRHAACLKPGVAPNVALRPIAHVVTHPINLDSKTCLGAIEIENIRADRMLPTKHRLSRRTLTQSVPQPHFRYRQRAPQAASVTDGFRRRSHDRVRRSPLHRASRGPPPPLRGGGYYPCARKCSTSCRA